MAEEYKHNLPIVTPSTNTEGVPDIGLGNFDMVEQNLNDNSLEADSLPETPNLDFAVHKSRAASLQSKLKFDNNSLYQDFLSTQGRLPAAQKPYSLYDQVDLDQTHTQLNSGVYIPKYRDFTLGTDNEDRLARQDSSWDRWRNGIGKFLGKTAVNIIDGTLGTVHGIAQGISQGSMNAVFNNDFSKYLDDVQTRMDMSLPNYMTQEERNMGFIRSMGTANFWANDVLGGLAFTIGALGTEAVWAVATGGSSLAVTVPKMALKMGAKGTAKALAKAGSKKAARTAGKKVVKQGSQIAQARKIASNPLYRNAMKPFKAYSRTIPTSKIAKGANNLRFLLTSSGFEAGVEARHSLNESLETFIGSYESMLGRKPNAEEMAAFMDDAKSNANNIFAANVALVGASNIAQFGRLFGVGTGLGKSTTRAVGKVFGQGITKVDDAGKVVWKALKPSRTQKILGTTFNILEKPFLEGVVEEGGQGVISNTSKNWLASRYNLTALQKNIDGIQAVKQAFHDAYGTREGRKEVGIGMIIGALGGGMSRNPLHDLGVTKFSNQTKSFEQAASALNQANTQITEAAATTLARLMVNNSEDTFTTEALNKLEVGDLVGASRDLDDAQFSKMAFEVQLGMLDETVADFEHVINNMTVEDFQKGGVKPVDASTIDNYKKALIRQYKENAEVVKKSLDIAEALDPSTENNGFFSEETTIKENFARQIFHGVKAGNRAEEIADTIREYVGSDGVGSALRFYTNINKKHKRRLQKIQQLQEELSNLQDEFSVLQQKISVAPTKSQRTTEDGETNTEIDANRQNAQKVQEKILNVKNEIESLEQTLDTRFRLNSFSFGGNFNIFNRDNVGEEGVITTEEQLGAMEELNKLEDYKKSLRNEGQHDVADTIDMLLGMYAQSMADFNGYNNTYNRMVSKGYGKKRGLAKLFSEALGTDYNDKTQFISPEAKEINDQIDATDYSDDVKFTLKTLNTMIAGMNYNNFTEEEVVQDVISDEVFEQFEKDGTVAPDVTESITTKMVNDEELSPRETEIYKANKDAIDNEVTAQKELKGDGVTTKDKPKTVAQQVGELAAQYSARRKRIQDSIEEEESKQNPDKDIITELYTRDEAVRKEYIQKKKELLTKPKPTKESKLTIYQKKIMDMIEKIKEAALSWSDYKLSDIQEAEIPTDKDYNRYKNLTIKRMAGNITGKELSELEDLESKLNKWARLQGAELNGVTISQLLERLAVTELSENRAEEIIKELESLGELIDEEFTERSAGRFYDVLQSYDKAFVSTLNGDFYIHNLTVDGFLNAITGTENLQIKVGKSNKVKTMPEGGWKLGTFAKTQKFTIVFPNGEEVKVNKDEHGRLILTESNKDRLEANSNFRLLPLGGNTAYNTLMKQVSEGGETYLKPVDSDITFEKGKYTTDTEAIFNLKEGDELSVHVAPQDDYNQHLLNGKGSTKLKATNGLLIYLKDKKGNIVGVFKSASETADTENDNLKVLQDIRRSVFQKLEDMDMTQTDLDMDMTVTVGQVYTGHPNITLKETSEGVAPVLNEIDESAASNILDIGYIQNGKVTMRGKKKHKYVEYYVSKIKRDKTGKYSGKKVPVVLFKNNGRNFLYPANMVESIEDFTPRLDEILEDTRTPISDKILEIQSLVIEAGLDINKYAILDNNLSPDLLTQLSEELSNVNTAPTMDEIMNSTESVKDLAMTNMKLNIDLNEKPLHSPKIRVDYSNVKGTVKPKKNVKVKPTLTNKGKKDVEAVKKNCK